MDHTTPSDVWNQLTSGNDRFVRGDLTHPHQSVARREEVAKGQHPTVAVFACADSRVSVEILADAGLGDLFVVRNAGQVLDSAVIGSLEYAVSALSVSLVLVLSHDSCGAVASAISSHAADATPLPVHIRNLIAPISPAVHRVAGTAPGESVNVDSVSKSEVGLEHLLGTVQGLLEGSEIIADALAAGQLAVVGANYELHSGRIVPEMTLGLDTVTR